MLSPSMTEAIWDTFHDRLWHFIRAHVSDAMAAEDVLQSVFLTVHQRLGDLRDETRLASWLFQITRHAIADVYRQHAHISLPAEAVEQLVAPMENALDIFQELIPCLYGLLPCLSQDDQEAIRLADFDAVPQQTLAARWGLSVSGAKSRIQRARARLKARLMAGCHLEINRNGTLVAFADGCACCRNSCSAAASFADVPRQWDAHGSCASSSQPRSTDMDTSETTTPTTPNTPPATTGGFQQLVTIPLATATTGCCGAPAADGSTCCGEPVSQVTDTTATGTDSCCGDSTTSGGGCCN